jgi:glycosyltransferase involved in cell wall biosynthesis
LSDVLAIIPAFNEAASLPALLQELARQCPSWEVLVINDGSTDRTGEVGRAARAKVIDLPFNSGVAAAEQTGFFYALEEGYSFVVRLDGDGQHSPAEAARLLAAVRNGGADVAIGSRFLGAPGFRSSWIRRMGIAWLSFLVTLLARRKVTDPTSGLRAFRRDVVSFLAQVYPGDYPEPESILLLARRGFRIVEVPVAMQGRQGGYSSIGKGGALYYVLKVTFALLVENLRRRGA